MSSFISNLSVCVTLDGHRPSEGPALVPSRLTERGDIFRDGPSDRFAVEGDAGWWGVCVCPAREFASG